MLDKNANIKIGKTVIETLTQGMYENPLFVYREYIQNAVDAIDKAVALSILENRADGEIYISIEKEKQQIIIEDNGTGIEHSKALDMLGNIALSEKDRTKDKGFRGIGRLGGLGYCDTLIFETSSKGEPLKTIMTWDALELRQKLFDKNVADDASEIVKSVATISKETESADKHYFKVILENIKNNELNELLNRDSIREYLSMVAPSTFNPYFNYKTEIYKYAEKQGFTIDEYAIFINDEKLHKPYKTVIYEGNQGKPGNYKKCDEITGIEFFEYKTDNGETLAWGWYGISKFEGVINKVPNYFRAIRLRKGNIEVGNEQTLVNRKITREERSNNYFIGEIYCIHQDLIPNSRRDYFNENDTLTLLEKELKDLFHNKLYFLYYTASNLRSALKTINKVGEIVDEIENKEKSGYVDNKEKSELLVKLDNAKQSAIEAGKKVDKIENNQTNAEHPAIKSVIKHIKIAYQKNYEKLDIEDTIISEERKSPRLVDKEFSSLPKDQRKLLDKIFQIIRNTLAPKEATQLINKIIEELKK